MYDLLLKGGILVDPYQSLEGRRDIAISNGKIRLVDETIDAQLSKNIIDVSGKIVTPGLIDIHTHVYWGGMPLGVNPDLECLPKGVTTVLDAGSAGCFNFLGFRKFVIERSKTRIIPLLHISSIGLIKQPELEDIGNLDYDGAVAEARSHNDLIKGFKIRFASPPNNHVGENGPQAMRLIKEAAEDVGGIIMVHPKSMSPNFTLEDILELLRPGDIVTHCFSPPHPQYFPDAEILTEKGCVLPAVKAAAQRGVNFDVGHGSVSFSFDTAKKAITDNFLPTTLSTDLFKSSMTTTSDMPTVMSKFLALGLPLSKVVELSTMNPAKILGFEGVLGTLQPGAEADVTIFTLEHRRFTFYDVIGNSMSSQKALTPDIVIKGGEIVHSNAEKKD
ncbi:MAG: amidohydrolase/deacetylase family metallohydrolase [Candidatus Bathyarchaeota archaeon]|nr:MAG: amidohydrolase/deacetylase family metallohydrolase [Candidatus Bathyarchaeota archaeon]